MMNIIRTRYGRENIQDKNERALYSLPAVALLLKLPLSEVRRLYRKFFSAPKPHSKLQAHHIQILTNQERLQQQASLTLKERCEEFNRSQNEIVLTPSKLRKIYKMNNIKKKVIKMVADNPRKFDEAAYEQRTREVKKQLKILSSRHREVWQLD